MENKTIFELAAELGRTLKDDARIIALNAARDAFEADENVKTLMTEYEVQQKALQGELVREERDTMFIDIIQKRIDELYNEIMGHPVFVELNEAQAEVNELMNAVNNTITFNITGEQPSCTGSCSTCGGGCAH